MSPKREQWKQHWPGAPRVSGDEPNLWVYPTHTGQCSPRERG